MRSLWKIKKWSKYYIYIILQLGMIYAMGSIGFLGLLVWSQRMAFLIIDNKVINFTVGWKG